MATTFDPRIAGTRVGYFQGIPVAGNPPGTPGTVPGVTTMTSSRFAIPGLPGGMGGGSGAAAGFFGDVLRFGSEFVGRATEGCPEGSVNTRSPVMTGILGPKCERANGLPATGVDPRVPTIFDPLGFVPGEAVASGVPAQPVARQVRRCPLGPDGRRMVLARFPGRPEECWPSPMVPKQFRSNPRRPRPPVTAADQRAIRKADSARKRLVRLTKGAGAHASMTRPRPAARRKC